MLVATEKVQINNYRKFLQKSSKIQTIIIFFFSDDNIRVENYDFPQNFRYITITGNFDGVILPILLKIQLIKTSDLKV